MVVFPHCRRAGVTTVRWNSTTDTGRFLPSRTNGALYLFTPNVRYHPTIPVVLPAGVRFCYSCGHAAARTYIRSAFVVHAAHTRTHHHRVDVGSTFDSPPTCLRRGLPTLHCLGRALRGRLPPQLRTAHTGCYGLLHHVGRCRWFTWLPVVRLCTVTLRANTVTPFMNVRCVRCYVLNVAVGTALRFVATTVVTLPDTLPPSHRCCCWALKRTFVCPFRYTTHTS